MWQAKKEGKCLCLCILSLFPEDENVSGVSVKNCHYSLRNEIYIEIMAKWRGKANKPMAAYLYNGGA
jgi:hypothetical protein